MKEIIPQFFTSLCVLCSVIVVSQIIRLSEVLVTFGLTLENVLMPFLFIMVPFLTFTIPMAYMFAVLLSFSRMSNDGEFTAMLAAGYSLRKAAFPVMIIGLLLYVVSTFSALYLEPWGNNERLRFYKRKAETQLDNMIKVRMKPGVFLEDFLGYVIYAEKMSPDRTHFDNVLLAPGSFVEDQNFTLLAPSASISGSVESGDLRMAFDYGVIYTANPVDDDISVVKFKRIELDLLRLFQEKIFGPEDSRKDYRSLRPRALQAFIAEMKDKTDKKSQEMYRKAHFLFHQRFGMPFASVYFALFAMVLGIQDERKGKNYGYIGTILTIILSYILVMSFKFWAEAGTISAFAGVWVPNGILTFYGLFLVYQRNRLPPSESTIDPRFVPGLRRFF